MLATPGAVAPKPDEHNMVQDLVAEGHATVEKVPTVSKKLVENLKTSPAKSNNLVSSPSMFLKNTPLSALKKRPREEEVLSPSRKKERVESASEIGNSTGESSAVLLESTLPPADVKTADVTKIDTVTDQSGAAPALKVEKSGDKVILEEKVDLEALGTKFPSFERIFRPAEYIHKTHQNSSKVFPLRSMASLSISNTNNSVTFISAVFGEGPMGLVFQPVPGRDDLFCVEDIVPDSQVEKKHLIQVGDLISAVNDTVLHGLAFEDVYGILRATPRPMVVRFTRGPGAIPPLPPPPRRVSTLPVPGDTRTGYINFKRSSSTKQEACPLDRAHVRLRNKHFLALQTGHFTKLINSSLGRELQMKSGRIVSRKGPE